MPQGYARQCRRRFVRLCASQRRQASTRRCRATSCRSRRLPARDRHQQCRRPRRQGRLSQPVRPAARDLAPSRRMSNSALLRSRLTGRTQFDGFDPVHRCPCRHARQQPQSPGGRADLGKLSAKTPRRGAGRSRARCSARRTRTTWPMFEQNRTRGDTAQCIGPSRTPLRDRCGRASPDRCGGDRARDLPRARHGLRRLYQSGPDASVTSP